MRKIEVASGENTKSKGDVSTKEGDLKKSYGVNQTGKRGHRRKMGRSRT